MTIQDLTMCYNKNSLNRFTIHMVMTASLFIGLSQVRRVMCYIVKHPLYGIKNTLCLLVQTSTLIFGNKIPLTCSLLIIIAQYFKRRGISILQPQLNRFHTRCQSSLRGSRARPVKQSEKYLITRKSFVTFNFKLSI